MARQKINTWPDRDVDRINQAVMHVESQIRNPLLVQPRYNDGEMYQVAATRIRGDVSGGQINPGSTGSIAGLVGVDGIVYETPPLTVRNKITGFAIPNGTTVLAQYVHEDEEWQVIEIAGEGSPTTDTRAYAARGGVEVGPFSSPGENIIGFATLHSAANMTTSTTRITATVEGLYSVAFHCSLVAQTAVDPPGTPQNLVTFTIKQSGLSIVNTSQVTRSWALFEPVPRENVSMSMLAPLAPSGYVEVFCGGTTSGLRGEFTLNSPYFSVARVSTNLS